MKNSSIQFNSSNIKELFSKKFLLVILISIPSAIVADYFNIPLAWMLGPMLAVSIAALSGIKIKMPKLALSSILIVLGLHIGNYIDQNLINQMTEWVWTSIIMFVYILISILIVSKYLQKFSGYNVKTSIFSAAPGALGPLMILAEHEKSDLSQVATSHLIRLIIIITVIPFFVVNYSTNEVLVIEKFNYLDQNHFHLLILLIGSISLIFVFDKIGVPAALLSGTLVASGILQISEVASYKLPDESINFCLLILGASVGCRFAEKSLKEVASNSFHSLIATAILVTLGLLAAIVATYFVDTNFLTLLLSFSPGGIYEVAVIAIAFDLDPNFVAFHHIIRLLMILFTVPVILKIIGKKLN
ncbi:AbrB family transcriptional regulator [Candidatus Pelagibacter sp.]|nr:AbrB family transcriptional regulator [Candidatus Pelagibacter sp.]MDB4246617.1 AbrB family transcriptional regulator [Candidatus Pelagibacter sp.]